MKAGILRAVGKEISSCWPDILESLDLDISMEQETYMENRIGTFNYFLSLRVSF